MPDVNQITYCVGCRCFHRPPLHEARNQHGYKHAEAFCLMTYASKDGTEVELVWNSRDGVTPFCISSHTRHDGTFDSTLSHTDWHRDIRLPDYKPKPGERYFADLTLERAREFAVRRIEQSWDDPKYPMREAFESKEEAIAELSQVEPGAPDLVEAKE